MNLKLAALSTALLFSGTMYADTVTVYLGQSNQNYTLEGEGGSGGYGTYLAQQGDCAAGASDTTCTLTGNFTSTSSGTPSGTYSLVTTYLNSTGGLAATSSTTVASDGGNYFLFNYPFSSDVNVSLDLNATDTIPVVVDGVFVADSFFVAGVSPACSGLPQGVPCTQGNVGLNEGSSFYGPVTGGIVFTTPSAIPEPEWLALGGMIPGAFMMLRRRLNRIA
jgi:hypothetical protein